jgi:phenylalanyl-tRNA synthetase beta subunit
VSIGIRLMIQPREATLTEAQIDELMDRVSDRVFDMTRAVLRA